jgi:hypothetical protein
MVTVVGVGTSSLVEGLKRHSSIAATTASSKPKEIGNNLRVDVQTDKGDALGQSILVNNRSDDCVPFKPAAFAADRRTSEQMVRGYIQTGGLFRNKSAEKLGL